LKRSKVLSILVLALGSLGITKAAIPPDGGTNMNAIPPDGGTNAIPPDGGTNAIPPDGGTNIA
jgi:hypothetical protein